MFLFSRIMAKRLDSAALKVAVTDSRCDCITTIQRVAALQSGKSLKKEVQRSGGYRRCDRKIIEKKKCKDPDGIGVAQVLRLRQYINKKRKNPLIGGVAIRKIATAYLTTPRGLPLLQGGLDQWLKRRRTAFENVVPCLVEGEEDQKLAPPDDRRLGEVQRGGGDASRHLSRRPSARVDVAVARGIGAPLWQRAA